MEITSLMNSPRELLEAWLSKLNLEIKGHEAEISALQSQINTMAINIENIKEFQNMLRMVIALKTSDPQLPASLRIKKAHELVEKFIEGRGNLDETLKELEELLAQAK